MAATLFLGPGGCAMPDGDVGGRRLLHRRNGAGRLRGTEKFRGLVWLPNGGPGQIREFSTPSGSLPLPACCGGSEHERLAETIHLCGEWWRPMSESVAASGGAKLIAVLASKISNSTYAVRRAERRITHDAAASRSRVAAGAGGCKTGGERGER